MEVRSVPKPTHHRIKPKRGNLTKFTPRVRQEIYRRASEQYGYPVCERCGISNPYCFETAHLINASQMGAGDEPWNGALVCGPSVNSNTCHHFLDYTEAGRHWKKVKRQELIKYYERIGWA